MPAFYHLGTADGLSDNSINSVCRDRNGIVWIGTTEGLNSFNGNTITTYYKEQYPVIPDNSIDQVVCDNDNDIWLRTNTSFLVMLDKQRRFIQYPIGNGQDRQAIDQLVVTKSHGVIALIGKKHFIVDKQQQRIIPLPVDGDSLLPTNSATHNHIDEDKVIFFGNNRLVIVDYAQAKVLLNMRIENIAGAAAINQSELIAYPRAGRKLYRVNIQSKQITTTYDQLVDQNGQLLGTDLRNIQPAGKNNFIITSRFSGVFHFNAATQKLQRWYHDPVDTRSIGGDNTSSITYDSTGYVFIGTRTSGLHYFNINRQSAGYRSYFRDTKGILFDGFIQAICASGNDDIWLGTQDRLIQWNRRSNEIRFVDYFLPHGRNLNGDETIRALSFDDQGRLWIGTTRHGILLLNERQQTIAQYAYDSVVNGIKFPSNWINAISRRNENETWVATLSGISIINQQKIVSDTAKHPLLSKIGKRFCYTVWFDSKNRIWIGTSEGAWCYDESSRQLLQYDQKNGLPDNRVLCFNEDNSGNIYAGTFNGLAIISATGKIETYNRRNGLRNNKCEGILKDHEGFLWIGNLNCILRFDPKTKKFAAFEEGWGFSHAGFRMRSCFQTTNGEMFWGSDKGLTWFMPQMMNQLAGGLHPTIHGLTSTDSVYRFTGSETIAFPYHSRSFNFQFSSGELTAGNRIQFLCRLRGFEKEWKQPPTPGQVSYNNLPPGRYHFEIKASRDGDNWYEGSYPVTIVINKPWWQQTWFRIAGLAVALGMLYAVYRYAKYRRQAIETQQLIAYFSNSGYEHSSVDDILWDICRNCISHLKFEDCVIYLLDSEKQVLVQKAAYGPKSPAANEIVNPIEIPLGRGIVGNVAQTGIATIVNDTSKDARYIVDDQRRNSEITVPLAHEGKVIGIIDSEHHRKNFFTKHHLQTLQTIASLCSANISRAMVMEAMKKSRMELMELNMKMAESKFLNLRLQMNPHFLFNSLSSIQHLIVSQQTTKAYKYLTVFSNFLRSLLSNAERNFIPLDEELKILRMYIELESLRFDQSFQYNIEVDESLMAEEVLVPPLIVQPFAENAIWHGLLHKEGDKKLSIRFLNQSDDHLTCNIEDNGVGRAQAAITRRNNFSAMTHESKGITIVHERLNLLSQKTGKPASVHINDLHDSNKDAAGTLVIITIPYYNPEET